MRPILKVVAWGLVVLSIGGVAATSYGIAYDGITPIWGAFDIFMFMASTVFGLMSVLRMDGIKSRFQDFSVNALRAAAVIFAAALAMFVPLATLSDRL